MVQVGLSAQGSPEDAVYAQHTTAQRCGWPAVERSGDHPVVYVAEHSHASYFGPDRIPPAYFSDHADGLGGGLFVGDVQPITESEPAWVAWPGSWGDSDNSPDGPAGNGGQWDDPSIWAGGAGGC